MITVNKLTEEEYVAATEGTIEMCSIPATRQALERALGFSLDRQTIYAPLGEGVLSSYHGYVRMTGDDGSHAVSFELYDYDYFVHGFADSPYADGSERDWHLKYRKGEPVREMVTVLLQGTGN